MDLDKNIKNKIEEYYKDIEEIPQKSLERMVLAEKVIEKVEKENEQWIAEVRNNELTISFFGADKKIGITRKSIYLDKYLLEYLLFRIKQQKDYFNVEKIKYLNEKYKELEKDYNKILNNMIDRFDIKIQINQCKNEIKDLIEEKKGLLKLLKEKEDIINNLNNELKSYKIRKLK